MKNLADLEEEVGVGERNWKSLELIQTRSAENWKGQKTEFLLERLTGTGGRRVDK